MEHGTEPYAGNADMIRIMEPTAKYPNGYFRYCNEHGQPLDINRKPGPQSATHHPRTTGGSLGVAAVMVGELVEAADRRLVPMAGRTVTQCRLGVD
jgi:hypothetical protein